MSNEFSFAIKVRCPRNPGKIREVYVSGVKAPSGQLVPLESNDCNESFEHPICTKCVKAASTAVLDDPSFDTSQVRDISIE